MLRLGMLTPSSNTVLEPVTAALLSGVAGVSAHFARFRVTQIALDAAARDQFAEEPILAAADLLADARVASITWNGTSASWLGFARDEALCRAITARTGIRAATAVLGFREALRALGVARVGLVTPYTADVQAMIGTEWGAQGFACVAERHCGLAENFAFATVTPERIAEMARAVAAEGAGAVVIVCTNMNGAGLVPALEAELGVPVLDSVAVALWAGLRAAGGVPAGLQGQGRLFALA